MSKWKLHLEGLSERALPSVVAPSPFNPIPDQYPNQPPLTPLPPGPGGTGIG